MPRQNDAGELIKSVTSLDLIRKHTTPTETTTTAAVTGSGAETTVAVTSAASFVAGDKAAIVGTGGMDVVKIGTTPATTMPVSPPPMLAQASGARFIRMLSVSMGKIALGSITWTGTRSLTSVFEEVGDTAVVQIPGNLEFAITFALFGHNVQNIQRIAGYEEDETGDGLAEATAFQGILGEINQALHTELAVELLLLRHDSKKFRLTFLNAYIEAAISNNPTRTTPATLNGTAKCSQLKVQQWV